MKKLVEKKDLKEVYEIMASMKEDFIKTLAVHTGIHDTMKKRITELEAKVKCLELVISNLPEAEVKAKTNKYANYTWNMKYL